jgi:long-subunit fatty acid transport protein
MAAACMTLVLGTTVHAGGLDRSGQSLEPLFTKGYLLSVDVYHSRPSVKGTDVLGQSTGQVADTYTQWGFAYKQDLSSQTSMLIMLSRPFGLDIHYDPQQSSLLGGTEARVSTHELMGALRYRWDEQWGVHGGLRMQRSEGNVGFGGLAFGAAHGYRVDFRPSTEPGYLLGLSYERPDISLRIAATYYSAIHHKMSTRENVLPVTTTTSSTSPQSVNLDVQSAIAPSTLAFGQIRWTQWSQFKLSPQVFAAATNGGSLADLEDTTTYTLGLGQKLSSQWSGFVSISYDRIQHTNASSALRPNNGRVGYALGVSYQEPGFKVTPWLSYQRLGAADITLASYPIARFGQSSAMLFGVKLDYFF